MKDKEEAALVQAPGQTVGRFREATDVANVCKEIVKKTAVKIGDREYVRVEGWTSIAVAHGCIASIKPDSVVEVLRDGRLAGIKAVAQLKRQIDGVVLSEAEGFVGDDEETWFGSHGERVKRWSKVQRKEIEVVIPKRLDYAIRSMAQTRATSKLCRNAFSHVVVLMDAGLSTTPYEEVNDPDDAVEIEAHAQRETERETKTRAAKPAQEDLPGDPADKKATPAHEKAAPAKPVEVPRDGIVALEKQFEEGRWKKVKVHFGTNTDQELGNLQRKSLEWYCFKWGGGGRPAKDKFAAIPPSEDDRMLRAALNVAINELGLEEPAS